MKKKFAVALILLISIAVSNIAYAKSELMEKSDSQIGADNLETVLEEEAADVEDDTINPDEIKKAELTEGRSNVILESADAGEPITPNSQSIQPDGQPLTESSKAALVIPQTTYAKTILDPDFYLDIQSTGSVTYSSDNEAVVQIESAGKVTLTGVGKAVITVNCGTKTAMVEIIVSRAEQTISMTTAAITKKYGSGKFQIAASAQTEVTYQSSDLNVLTVDSNGYVTIVAKNTTKSAYVIVSAQGNDVYNSASEKKVLVKWEKASQSITAKNQTISVGSKNKVLGVKAKTKLSYKSSNSKIVSVNSKGQITAKKAGTVKIAITAKSSNQYNAAKKTITIKVVKNSQKITAANKTYTVGSKNKDLGAKAKTGLTYKSSNNKIVTVNAKGKITAKKAGTAKISITAKGTSKYKAAKKTITIKVVRKSQSISATNKTYTVGNKNKALGVKAKTGLTFKSSNSKIVSVNSNGQVTALDAGTVKITISAKKTAAYNNAKKVITITVLPKKAAISKITSPAEKQLKVEVKSVNGVTGYQIRYSTNVSMSNANTIVSNNTKRTIIVSEVQEKDITYYVQVRSYKSVAGKDYYSGWSDMRTIKVQGHKHNWQPIYETITHPEQGHWETKVVEEAYDEDVYAYRSICNGCGADLTELGEMEFTVHLVECYPGSYSVQYIKIDTIHHEEVTDEVWVVDVHAWTEHKIIGYKCSKCGSIK